MDVNVRSKLIYLQVGKCTCLSVMHATSQVPLAIHATTCTYRLAVELEALLNKPRSLLDIARELYEHVNPSMPLRLIVHTLEEAMAALALSKHKHLSEAAQHLGIERVQFYRRYFWAGKKAPRKKRGEQNCL